MSDVIKLAATVPMTAELAEDVQFAPAFNKMMAEAAAEMMWALQEEAENRHIGPFHGPGRREKWDAELPMRKRNALRVQMQMYRMMSGKRPGRFVRAGSA